MVHVMPRTRSLSSFVRDVILWLIATMALACVATWVVCTALGLGDWGKWWPGLVGAGMGLLAATFSQVAVTKAQGLAGVLDVRQSVTMTIAGPVSEAIQSFRDALKAIHATELEAVGSQHINIWAKARGNELHFSCHPNPDGSLEVQIRSYPRSRWAFIDRGSNLFNVRQLTNAFWWREARLRYAS